MAQAARQRALFRPEMLMPSEPRKSADGAMSMAVKTIDPDVRRMIDEALARRS